MKVYHGTNLSSAFNICVSGIDLHKSEQYLDFGMGFYTTDDKIKAIKRALKKTRDFNRNNGTNEPAYLVEVMIDFGILQDMSIMEFNGHGIDWCQFVLYNRLDMNFLDDKGIKFHNIDNKYDVVLGEIADGKIAEIAYDIRAGKKSLDDVDYSAFLTYDDSSYGNQISFHTEKSLSCIVGISCDIIWIDKKVKEANRNDKKSKRV